MPTQFDLFGDTIDEGFRMENIYLVTQKLLSYDSGLSLSMWNLRLNAFQMIPGSDSKSRSSYAIFTDQKMEGV